MIINWVAAKAQQFLAVQDTGLDELNVSFDFALSPEIMNLLFAQNDDCMAATAPGSLAAFPPSMEGRSGGTTPRMGEVESRLEQRSRAIAEAAQQAEDANATAITQFALDEHELALA